MVLQLGHDLEGPVVGRGQGVILPEIANIEGLAEEPVGPQVAAVQEVDHGEDKLYARPRTDFRPGIDGLGYMKVSGEFGLGHFQEMFADQVDPPPEFSHVHGSC